MARIRSIHPAMPTDEAFMSMSMTCRAAWPLLWTQCDDQGVFEWKPIVLKARIFPADSLDFADVLAELERLDCIKKYEVDGKSYGLVRNFSKYQRPKKPNAVFPFPEWGGNYTSSRDLNSEAVPHLSDTDTENAPQMEDGGDNRKDEGVKEPAPARDEKFPGLHAFWQACPRKVGYGSVEHSYRNALGIATPETLLAAMLQYAKNQQKTEKKYIKSPAHWLQEKRWLDEDVAPQVAAKVAAPKFFVIEDSPAFQAWVRYRGKPIPAIESRNHSNKRGWYFETEWPPGYLQSVEHLERCFTGSPASPSPKAKEGTTT